MNAIFPIPTVFVLLTAHLAAASMTFDFKDPKGVNNAVFKLDAPLEAINGTATGISGAVTFDPDDPGATRGTLLIEASSLHVPNPLMKEHMLGEQWLNVSEFPTIQFQVQAMSEVRTSGNTTSASVTGTLTLKGKAKVIQAPVKLTYLKGKLADRTNGRMQGDLLVVRSNFTVKRTDFDINPGAPQDKVADEIEITLSIAGAAPKS